MAQRKYYLAIDIGASSGRHILGWLENGKIRIEEIYRFENKLVKKNGHLCWDIEHLFNEVKAGIKECGKLNRIPASLSIDTWGVDFVLLDKEGKLLGDTVAYRDSRTRGMDEEVYRVIGESELYSRNGIQKQLFNSIYQLMAIKKTQPELLAQAEHFLMIPEYLHYLLTGQMVRYFDATDETYEALSTDDPDQLKIQDNSVALRVEEHVAALNAFLNIFCLQVGLSAGTFSFDAASGLKTATEVVSENSKTYKTVKNFQNQIVPAIERLVESVISVASLYDLRTADGYSVAQLAARGYETKVTLDDGITQDRQTNINEGITLVGAGLMSKHTFLTDPKYGQNLTEEDAAAELQRIAQESTVTMPGLDVFDVNGAE